MMGRHQFRRRFSLQPTTMRDSQDEGHHRNSRNDRIVDTENSGKPADSTVQHKIVVLGASKVGKTSLINQFLYNNFPERYKSTVEEMHHGEFNVKGLQLKLDILDTSGTHEFPVMRDLAINKADAFVLLYDVNDPRTFVEVEDIRNQISLARGVMPMVVVGNKTDLGLNDTFQVDSDSTRHRVTTEWGNGFVEISAKDSKNISQVFQELLTQAKVKYNLSPAMRKRRQSLPPPHHMHPRASSAHVPSLAQLQHLQQIREQHESKRNSCTIS